MPPSPGPTKAPTRDGWAALVIVTLAVWLLRGYLWPVQSNVEVDVLRAMIDPTLFQRDFAVQESLHFNPRFYYNQLILLPARAGLPLAWVFAGWHLVALALLIGSVRALGRHAGLGEGATAVLVLWLLVVSIGLLGSIYIYLGAPTPAVWSISVAAWGAVLVARERWTGAFACFAAAVLLQFLVGFYAGLIAVGALLWSRRGRGLAATLPWLAGLALVYGPMAVSGGTDSGAVDRETFVEIYAWLRLPHHLVPSTWNWAVGVQAALFYAGALVYLYRTRTGRPAGEFVLLAGSIALATLALGLNYLFVEVYPVALVAKLQLARLTAFAQILTLLLLATRVQARFSRRDWVGGIALCLVPFTILPGALLLLAAILLPDRERPAAASAWILLLAVVLAVQPFGTSIVLRMPRYALWALIVAVQVLVFRHQARTRLLAVLAGIALAAAGAIASASRAADWPAALARHFSIDSPPNSPPGVLGLRFGRQSHPDVLVLVPPAADSWCFKLYAQRAVVVDDKSMPFTDRGMREWKERMDQLLGQPLVPAMDVTAAWRARTPAAVAATAARYGARYVLTRDEDHPVLPGEVIDREAGWSLWALPR